MNIIFGSGGNDSIALTQLAIEKDLTGIHVAYSNTQWAADFWPERIRRYAEFVERAGGKFHEIQSQGMLNLVKSRKMWPQNGKAFCSFELKIKPAMEWLDVVDPEREATCLVGIRREESAKRGMWPEWVESSENHGGRSLYSPMVRYSAQDRDALILRAGFDVLPHRSMECSPCIPNGARDDIAMLSESRIEFLEICEKDMGSTRNGKPRYIFSPGGYKQKDGRISRRKRKGARGIREVVMWARTGNFVAGQADIFCDSGFCGS